MFVLFDGASVSRQFRDVGSLLLCEDFVKTPDLSKAPNLKHIHPSTGHLTKLVELDLRHCTSLISLPFHFFNSKRDNDAIRLWKFSLDRLIHLYSLNLSYCNLDNIPEAIASLHNSEGNNIVTIPNFVNKLPRLKRVELARCKWLMYSSGFPLPSLVTEPTELINKGVPVRRLGMFNCPKLVEKERLSGMAISWMRESLKCYFHNQRDRKWGIPVAKIREWDGVTAELVHLCLLYFPRKLFIAAKEHCRMQHDLDGPHFKFGLDISFGYVKVKNRGMRAVLKQDLEEPHSHGY
ncbi:hypothetical protein PIB30_040724 [Stylosanthes scabra]|uniref:Uncharacterized protein n=1 Tax=Stylosanthes scabra TaxID=79078 RepID=A0ABU6UGR8_9FABA|nr:hypothetical protein [Stylosanthes scabra]